MIEDIVKKDGERANEFQASSHVKPSQSKKVKVTKISGRPTQYSTVSNM